MQEEHNELSDRLPSVLTVPEMAKVLRIGRNSAYELVRTGQVPSIKVGRLVRIPREGLLNWLTNEKPLGPDWPAA